MAITNRDQHRQTLFGLSTDAKPTAPPVGTTFYEIDTGKTYRFHGTWDEIDTIAALNPTGYEIVAVTTTDANYNAVTFSQAVKFFDISVRGRANVGRFRAASGSGEYIQIAVGETRRIFKAGTTVGYVARDASTDITFEAIGYY